MTRAREPRAAQGESDPQGREHVFREGTRREPSEVSAFIDHERKHFAVELICRPLGIYASACYARKTAPLSDRAVRDEPVLGEIRRVHRENYRAYGYGKTWKAPLRDGEVVPRCHVQRSTREHGIVGAKRRGRPWRTTTADPMTDRAPNLANRWFIAEAPDR